MKKLLIALGLAGIMTMVMAAPAMAAETQDASASVTVNTYISITIADEGSNGIAFGSLDPGATNQGDADQLDGTPSVVISTGSENNVNVDLQISGTNFTKGGDSFNINNASYSGTFAGSKTALSGTDTDIVHGTNVAAGQDVDMYQWLTVPASTPPGTYSSTWTYTCVTV